MTTLPNGRTRTVTYDPHTDMVREVETGPGFESVTTYPRNNPNMRSMSTRSNNNNNYMQYSGNPNPNLIFPPGFPFNNIAGRAGGSSNFNMGMGFPFSGGVVDFESGNRRGRRAHRNRNDIGQIFGVNNGDFDSLY